MMLREALINSISHDLQTPLASILGSATALQSFETLYDARGRAELIGTIRDEAERLHDIIENIVDLSRIRAGQRVYLLYPAANRDPGHFTEPDRFDPARPQGYGHASFGFGAHFCLGAGLARMEARALFAELLARYGSIRESMCCV